MFSEGASDWECGCGIFYPSGHVATDVCGRSSASFAVKLMTLTISSNSPSFLFMVDMDCIGSTSCCLTTFVPDFVNLTLNSMLAKCCYADGSKELVLLNLTIKKNC